jgi:hypothetical protein
VKNNYPFSVSAQFLAATEFDFAKKSLLVYFLFTDVGGAGIV